MTPANETNGRLSSIRDSGVNSNGEPSQATIPKGPSLGKPLNQGSVMGSDVDVSGNGGIFVKYPSSYATIGGSNHHQNIIIERRDTNGMKNIEYNVYNQRLGPPNRPLLMPQPETPVTRN